MVCGIVVSLLCLVGVMVLVMRPTSNVIVGALLYPMVGLMAGIGTIGIGWTNYRDAAAVERESKLRADRRRSRQK